MRVLVMGLVNMETNINIGSFPINYSPIEFSFFKTKTNPSGVALNLAIGFKALEDDVMLYTLGAKDSLNQAIVSFLKSNDINYELQYNLKETPESIILFDDFGTRKIYCDLKDCQEKGLDMQDFAFDLACLTNINFARPYLKLFKEKGVKIATDCHVLSNIYDEFNHDFLVNSDILFISDEMIRDSYKEFMNDLIRNFDKEIIVISRGTNGVYMYVKKDQSIAHYEAYPVDHIVNTVGAGDSLFMCFNHYYAQTNDPYYSIRMAMKYASIKISSNGGAIGFMKKKDFEAYEKK